MRKPGPKRKGTSKQPAKKPLSAGENSLECIYEQLKAILAKHAPPLKLCEMQLGKKSGVQLVVPKPVAVAGAYGGKPVNLQMAAAILQKDYVGFYLMCIYASADVKRKLSPALLKLLKGKSCFHVKALDEGLRKDIEEALVLSEQGYQANGWL
ncbi:MAG TPA: hypothetical protein VL128_00435 [Candidatus Eisenbacteria bacterium]|nr:hypothetical protein [Candidatus Eisenbacteria bacterium]